MPRLSTASAHRLLVLASTAAVLAGCARNPVTGRTELALISEEQEIAMGRQAAQEVVQTIGLVDDEGLQAYVQRIGRRLAEKSERPALPWTFGVVDDPTPNAFALPGGYIFVTRGLASLMNSEAELAAVLGHEIGHVTARHTVQALSRQQLAQLGLGLGAVFIPGVERLGDVLGAGFGLLFLKYGRDAERQADELGFRYTLREGYDVRDMVDVFVTLQRIGEGSGRSPVPSWLATHPYPEERINAAQRRIAALQGGLDTLQRREAAYLGEIESMVYGVNPRHGFFEGSTFLHPDLRFRVTFPQGWQGQNLRQAVLAGSPQRDAIIQLTLSREASLEGAARLFLTQRGVQAGQVSEERINGLPALSSSFQAQSQQGEVRGLALFIAHEGRVYQVIAFAPAERFASYDGVFRQSLGSFAPVTDPRVLNVRPNRIALVRLDQAMTLSEFNQRHPSVVPIAELAIINQVEGPGTRIAAGTTVKRVVGG